MIVVRRVLFCTRNSCPSSSSLSSSLCNLRFFLPRAEFASLRGVISLFSSTSRLSSLFKCDCVICVC